MPLPMKPPPGSGDAPPDESLLRSMRGAMSPAGGIKPDMLGAGGPPPGGMPPPGGAPPGEGMPPPDMGMPPGGPGGGGFDIKNVLVQLKSATPQDLELLKQVLGMIEAEQAGAGMGPTAGASSETVPY